MFLNDQKAESAWLDAHNRRHHVYTVNQQLPGNSIFDGPVDGDWMLRHTMTHTTLANLAHEPLTSANVIALGLPGRWKTEQELDDWHALHNRLHFIIDHRLGVAGHTAHFGARPVTPRPPPGPLP
jgi:hypothetical protein